MSSRGTAVGGVGSAWPQGKRATVGTKPVVAIDIDGTLGDFHGHFLRFAEQYLGRECGATVPYTGGSLARHMHTSKSMYRQVKLAYRQGGMKRSMPVYPYASELTVGLRKAGAEVWLCTTRPYLRLDNIDPDTRHWLRRNGIQYDGVIFGERKYRDLVGIVGLEAVVAVLEDLPEMVLHANDCGLPAYLRDQPYNRWPAFADWRGERLHDLEEASAMICDDIENWKKERA